MAGSFPRWPKGYAGYGSPGTFSAIQSLLADTDSPVKIVVLGDSIAEGFSAGSFNDRWVEALAPSLRDATGRAASVGMHRRTFYSGPANPWYTIGGTVTANGTLGFGLISATMSANGTMTITAPAGASSCDIYYIASPGLGSLEIRVDTVLVDTVNTATGNTGAGRFVNVAGLSGGEVIEVRAINAFCAFDGIWFYTGDEADGICVLNGGKAGASIDAFNNAVSGNHLTQLVTNAAPNLLLVGLGSNDWAGGASASTIATRINTFVTKCRAADADIPIIFQSYNERNDAGPEDLPWRTYRETIAAAALANGCLYYDWGMQMGTFKDASNIYRSGDGVHPNGLGHNLITQITTEKLT